MDDAHQGPNLLQFGTFELDINAAELRKEGHKVRLRGQPFHLLAELAARPMEVVTREDLRRKLWPPETFVDFENSLNIAVNKLRQALGDSAENPLFVETLPRVGYRFVAPVRITRPETVQSPEPGAMVTGESPAVLGSEVPSRGRHWTRSSRRLIMLAALASLVLSLTAAVLALNPSRVRDLRFGSSSNGQIKAVAVLPLKDLSADTPHQSLADGMTEELIAELAQNRTFRVASRTSVMQYEGTRKALPQIGKELKVDAVVEGAVMHAEQRVRVVVKLVLAEDDRHVWTGRYERDLGDVLTMRAELARSIAHDIEPQLTTW